MTKEQALLWVLGVVGSVCAGAVTLDKVMDIIHNYIKKAQAPDAAQNQRLDAIEQRLGAVESISSQHAAALKRDLTRFDAIEEEICLALDGVRNLLDAQLSGDNHEGMQKSKASIDNYLLKGVTNHGSNQ
mgnify:FL=1